MKKLRTLFTVLLLTTGCQAQDNRTKLDVLQHVGGPCEGCEAIHEYGEKTLSPVDTLPAFGKPGTDKLKITGTVYQQDGVTPARGVILYIYHTDETGLYPKRGNETGWARRHGYLRGWIRTGPDGRYTFYTLRPHTYPSRTEPAHIHITVKEPDKNAYYLDDFLFDDDPLLSQKIRASRANRGGSGLVSLQKQGDLLMAERDIILGRNIPGYD
ncbi:intradiol ring-cleavage dioxygenase [Pontibacter sp. JH31]|uniref:Intradiol ring-cleavage dioxygenase n=1 Tax=Pontibacter aquaedesilientis TaxID=2766980 RepID=A0ABR7XBK3_9BACT|nr:intradiol ring-cleavage dioxygenase [Pontibacter aquaedesilientis]MBD1395687.1 intradiol ring-cleavage dioxygenase [Pontibacter aquaedesilientis]